MFDVIGYGDFDLLISDNNKWLERVSTLFEKLNVEIDNRFDARVGQLKRVYKASVEILLAFNSFNTNQETIPSDSLQTLKEFAEKL